MLNAIKSVLADVSSVSPSSEQSIHLSLLWRRANPRNISQHTLYGVQHIQINLMLIHCTFEQKFLWLLMLDMEAILWKLWKHAWNQCLIYPMALMYVVILMLTILWQVPTKCLLWKSSSVLPLAVLQLWDAQLWTKASYVKLFCEAVQGSCPPHQSQSSWFSWTVLCCSALLPRVS